MKSYRLEKLLMILLLVVLGGIVIHAPLSVWLGTILPEYSLLIKSWKEILLTVCVPLASVVVTRRKMWGELFGDWLFRLILAFAGLHFALAALLYTGTASTAAGLGIDLRFLLFFCLVYVAVKVSPEYRRRFMQVGVAGAIVVVGFATLQLFLPRDILSNIGYGKDTIAPYLTVDKNPQFVRQNSTLRGPNPLGAYAGIVLSCLAAVWVRKKEWLVTRARKIAYALLVVTSLTALWVSYSRSALVAGIGAILLVIVVGLTRNTSRWVWVAGVTIVAAVVGGLALSKGSDFVSNIILHENPNGGSQISSNEDHAKSLINGLQRVAEQPLGAGVGSTGSASLFNGTHQVIENQYLFIAHEAGWLGLVVFMGIFWLILSRLWARRKDWLALGVFASGLGLAAIGLLLPIWADDTVSIVWWGVAAIALGGRYEYATK